MYSYSPVEVQGTSCACMMASSEPSDPRTFKQSQQNVIASTHSTRVQKNYVFEQQLGPRAVLPEECEKPRTEARSEQCPAEEVPLGPKRGLFPWAVL